jgi:hypothetical protein
MLAAVACAAALSFALWSPALPDLLHTRSQFTASRGDEPTLLGHEGHMLLWNLLGMGALPQPGISLGAILGAFLVLPLLAIGLRGCFADRQARRALGASALGLPIALALVWVAGSWFYARFMLFSLPGVALTLGRARWPERRGLFALLARDPARKVRRPLAAALGMYRPPPLVSGLPAVRVGPQVDGTPRTSAPRVAMAPGAPPRRTSRGRRP